MGRIVFAWEFGGGLGHILYDLPLARKLQARGHEVICLMRHVIDADRIMRPHGIRVIQAPVWQVAVKQLDNTFNYAETLLNKGYLVAGALSGMTRAWRNHFEYISPDLLIADHAPTAIIAARTMGLKTALYGTGFFSPPKQDPMPSLIPWGKIPDGLLEYSEKRLVSIINQVLAEQGVPSLSNLAGLFDVEADFLATFAELDHYPPRERVRYWGPVLNLAEGQSPFWPDSGGTKKIFCYLKPTYPHLEELLSALQQIEAAIIIFLPEASRKIGEKFKAPNMIFAANQLNMSEVCSDCDMVICHAGHGTMAAALLFGRPLVLLPEDRQLEQVMIAKRASDQNFGRYMNTRQKQRDYKGIVSRVLTGGEFTAAARSFAEKYKDFDPVMQLEEIADSCEVLIQARTTG